MKMKILTMKVFMGEKIGFHAWKYKIFLPQFFCEKVASDFYFLKRFFQNSNVYQQIVCKVI